MEKQSQRNHKYYCLLYSKKILACLYEVFKAALVNNRIQAVKAIIKLMDSKYVHEALRSILIKNSIESEGCTTNRDIRILHPDNYGKAFVHAVLNYDTDILQQFFINSSRFEILSSDYFDQALAISHEAIYQLLIKTKRFKNLNIVKFEKP